MSTVSANTSIAISTGSAGRYFRFSTDDYPFSPSDTTDYDRNQFEPELLDPAQNDGFIYKFPWVLQRDGDKDRAMTTDDELGEPTGVGKFLFNKSFGDTYVFRDGVTYEYAAEGVRNFIFGHRYTEIHDEIKGWPEAGSTDYGFVDTSASDAEVFRIPNPESAVDANANPTEQQTQANAYGATTVEQVFRNWSLDLNAELTTAFNGLANQPTTESWDQTTYDEFNEWYKSYQVDVEGVATPVDLPKTGATVPYTIRASDALDALDKALELRGLKIAEDFNGAGHNWRGSNGPLDSSAIQALKDLFLNSNNSAGLLADYRDGDNSATDTVLQKSIADMVNESTLLNSSSDYNSTAQINSNVQQLGSTVIGEWQTRLNRAVDLANAAESDTYLDEDREGIITKSWGNDFKYEWGKTYEWAGGPDKDSSGTDYDMLRKGKHQTYSYGPRYEEKLTTKQTGKIEDYSGTGDGEADHLDQYTDISITIDWGTANVERTLGDAHEYYSGNKLEVTSGHKEEHVFGKLREEVHAHRTRHAHGGADEYIYEDGYEYVNGAKTELIDKNGIFKGNEDAAKGGPHAKREWIFGSEEVMLLGGSAEFKMAGSFEMTVGVPVIEIFAGLKAEFFGGGKLDICLAFVCELAPFKAHGYNAEAKATEAKIDVMDVRIDGILTGINSEVNRIDQTVTNVRAGMLQLML